MDSLIANVVEELNMQQDRDGCTCVCLHAMGGAGKSTLAECVYYWFTEEQQRIDGYYHCKVELALIEDDVSLAEKQKDILEKLLESSIPSKIRHIKDGKQMMNNEITKLDKPVFLVLDNVNLSQNQIEYMVPKATVFRPGSAILVTTRDQGIKFGLEDLGFSPVMRAVPMLNHDDARLLLYQSIGCDRMKVAERVREECEKELLKVCGGIPLVLKVAGGVIRARKGLNKEQVWQSVVQSIKEGEAITGKAEEKDPVLASLKFSIDDLSQELRQSFFDIISFFNHKKWWHVAYAVGEDAMEDLKARHLIQENVDSNIDWHSIYHINELPILLTKTSVQVHDVMHGLGLKMMEDELVITYQKDEELQSLERFDGMKLRKIRGICPAPFHGTHRLLAWRLLCQMENIRFIKARGGTEVEQFLQPLKNLRAFFLDGRNSSLPFALDKAPKLKIFEGENIDMQLLKPPKGLKFLSLGRCKGPLSFERWQLEYLKLSKCQNLKTLEGIQHLRFLKHFILIECENLREVDGLTVRETLDIQCCIHIQTLKSCNFSSLRCLRLHKCPNLKEIPLDFENLQYLAITECPSLHQIPNFLKFRQIVCFLCNGTSVKQMPFLPTDWTHQHPPYPSLRHISVAHSYHLLELPNNFFSFFPNLQTLDLSHCRTLVCIPEDINGQTVSQLRMLRLKGSVSLQTLNVSQLCRLEILDLSQCWKLQSFRSILSLFSFRRLKKLNLVGCWRLKEEAEEILQHLPPSLKKIDLSGCLNMEEIENLIPNKRMASVQVISRPSSWRQEMNEQEMLEKISKVLGSLNFLDFKDNVVSGTDLDGKQVCLIFENRRWPYSEEALRFANFMHSELENAGKPLQFIFISSSAQHHSILPVHWIKLCLYHAHSLLSVHAEMQQNLSKRYDETSEWAMVMTKVGDGSAHVFSDAKYLWKQFGLAGYPFTTDHLAKAADPPLSLSSLLGYHTSLVPTANAFPFTEYKFSSPRNRCFLNATAIFLLCNSNHRYTKNTQVFMKSLEGTVDYFVFIRICSEQSLDIVVKDYHNLKEKWKERLRVICLLDNDLRKKKSFTIPQSWLIAVVSTTRYREKLSVDSWKQDKKNLVLYFLLERCIEEDSEWSLGFDGEGQMIRDGRVDRSLFQPHLDSHYNANTSSTSFNTIPLTSEISNVWERSDCVDHPQHHPCHLFICLASRFCDICQHQSSMEGRNSISDRLTKFDLGVREWFYGCSLCDFHMCLNCHANILTKTII